MAWLNQHLWPNLQCPSLCQFLQITDMEDRWVEALNADYKIQLLKTIIIVYFDALLIDSVLKL
jgi:hypothetical protein